MRSSRTVPSPWMIRTRIVGSASVVSKSIVAKLSVLLFAMPEDTTSTSG